MQSTVTNKNLHVLVDKTQKKHLKQFYSEFADINGTLNPNTDSHSSNVQLNNRRYNITEGAVA